MYVAGCKKVSVVPELLNAFLVSHLILRSMDFLCSVEAGERFPKAEWVFISFGQVGPQQREPKFQTPSDEI